MKSEIRTLSVEQQRVVIALLKNDRSATLVEIAAVLRGTVIPSCGLEDALRFSWYLVNGGVVR